MTQSHRGLSTERGFDCSSSAQNLLPARKPLGFRFTIDFASPEEVEFIFSRNVIEGRQTMNLRTSTTTKMFVLKDNDNSDRVIGWCGIDLKDGKDSPESFSCFVEPAYRGFALWNALECARCEFAQANGVTGLMGRMAVDKNRPLFEKRIASGLYRHVPKQSLTASFLSMCLLCHLHANVCSEQAHIQTNVGAMLKFVQSAMGLGHSGFPKSLVLQPKRFQGKQSGDWNCEYKPVWIQCDSERKKENA